MKQTTELSTILITFKELAQMFLKRANLPVYEKTRWNSFIEPITLEKAKTVRVPGIANFIFVNNEENIKRFQYLGDKKAIHFFIKEYLTKSVHHHGLKPLTSFAPTGVDLATDFMSLSLHTVKYVLFGYGLKAGDIPIV